MTFPPAKSLENTCLMNLNYLAYGPFGGCSVRREGNIKTSLKEIERKRGNWIHLAHKVNL